MEGSEGEEREVGVRNRRSPEEVLAETREGGVGVLPQIAEREREGGRSPNKAGRSRSQRPRNERRRSSFQHYQRPGIERDFSVKEQVKGKQVSMKGERKIKEREARTVLA